MKPHADAVITCDADFKEAVKASGMNAIGERDCAEFFKWVEVEYGVSYSEVPF